MSLVLMTAETSVLVSSTRGASAVTSTWVVLVETDSMTFRSRFCPTRSSAFLSSQVLNPDELTVTVYPAAGTRAGAVNTPPSLVLKLRIMPFDGFATTTFALGTTEPDASRTTPEMDAAPALVWPKAVDAHNNNTGTKPKRDTIR